jgi:hypothetical protein
MINGFAAFARENSKVGKLRSDVSLPGGTNYIVPRLDVLQDRTNGFIHEWWSFLR